VIDFAVERGVPRRGLENLVGQRTGAAIRGDAAHAVLAHVVRELDDSTSVWDVAQRARPADYGPYGFVLQASDTVGDALVRAARFFPAIGTTAEMSISTDDQSAKIIVRRRDGAKSVGATHYLVAQIIRLVAAISGERVRARAVHLPFPQPSHPLSLERAIGFVPRFGAPVTSIEIDRASLAIPLPRRDPDLTRYFDGELGQNEDRSTAGAVRRAMDRAIALGASTAEDDLARALGVGTRTLRRQLAGEGTTLRAVFDEVRLEVALERLRRPQLSLAQLAFELGFSDQTAFSRAFRRWTGRSPAEFRRLTER
jgi:AraC-like DNA-binding protein